MERISTWKRIPAYGALVLTAALWASNGVIARVLFESVPPVTLAVLRWMVVLALLSPVVWPERRAIRQAIRRDWRMLLPFAVFGSLPQNALVYTGLAHTTAIHLGLLNSTIPVLILLIGWGFYGLKPRRLELAGVAVSLAGVLLVLAHGDLQALARLDFNPADLVCLAGMVTWAIFTLKLKDRPQALSLYAFLFTIGLIGQLLTLPALALELGTAGEVLLGQGVLLGILYMGALPTLAAMLLYGFAVHRVGAVQAGIYTHFMPVFTAVFAATFIGERLFPYHAVGFVLVAGGAVMSCLRQAPVLSSRPPAAS